MEFSKLPPVEPYSFLLGLLCGILFYYLVIVKRYIQRTYAFIKLSIERLVASTNLDKAEALIIRSIYTKAQSSHLTSHLFPLESILISPHLIAPPKHLYPEFYTTASSLTNLTFPFVPDWPELSAQFPVDLLSYQQLANINGKVVILGQPGSGKTVLLSALTIHMLENHKAFPFPIFLSAKRILACIDNEKDLFNVLAKAFSDQIPQISTNQIHYFIKSKISSHTAILLIDDVDHLHENENDKLLRYLSELDSLTKFKRIILAADPNRIGKELLQQYYPLPIASWSLQDQSSFIQQFQTSWNHVILTQPPQSKDGLPASILTKWIQDETLYYSPYDLAIRSWVLNAGYGAGATAFICINTIMDMLKPSEESLESLSLLAYAILRTNRSSITIQEVNDFYSSLSQTVYLNSTKQMDSTAVAANKTKQKIQESSLRTPQISIFLEQTPDGQFSFSSPIWVGYFGSLIRGVELTSWFSDEHLNWSYAGQYLRFATIQNQADQWHESCFQKENRFIFDNSFLKIARIIPDLPPDHPVRNGILKWIAKNAFTQPVPAPMKAKLFAALLISNDPSLPKLLQDFQSVPDPELRFLAVLTNAACSKNEPLDAYINHLSDEDQNVRNAATMTFYAMQTKKSTDLLIDILLQGDEYMKQIAAEAVSQIPSIRKELLTEALTSEDLLIRRAAVFGLARIPEQWAIDLLSHTAIEDAQWIVRNAASQIVENRDFIQSQIIPQLPHPSNAPWLIGFASKLGKGIPKSGFVKDILLSALDQGNLDEKIAAMNYLRVVPDEDIVRAVLTLLVQKNKPIQQAASLTLWYIEKILGTIPVLKEKRIT